MAEVIADTNIEVRTSGERSASVVRCIIGIVLIAAALLKAFDLVSSPTVGTGIFQKRWFLILAVEAEFLLGMWLLSGLYRRASWALSLSCFSVFLAVALYSALSGKASCGCFGRVSINPRYTVIFDSTALVSLALFRPPKLADTPRFATWMPWAGGALMVAVAGGAYLVLNEPTVVEDQGAGFVDGSFVILEPDKWIGKRFELSDYLRGERVEGLLQDQWLLMFYHHDCPSCQETLPKVLGLAESLAGAQDVPLRFALVDIPPHGPRPIVPLVAQSIVQLFKLDSAKEWFVVTPTAVLLDDGMVLRSWEKDVPTDIKTILSRSPADAESARFDERD